MVEKIPCDIVQGKIFCHTTQPKENRFYLISINDKAHFHNVCWVHFEGLQMFLKDFFCYSAAI